VQTVHKTLSQKTLHKKIGLVEWLKVKALSSSLVPTKKKKHYWGLNSSLYAYYAGTLYHLSHNLQSFLLLVIFQTGSHFYAWVGLDHNPPIYVSCVAGMTGMHHHAPLLID
jgi:hypothetical protein